MTREGFRVAAAPPRALRAGLTRLVAHAEGEGSSSIIVVVDGAIVVEEYFGGDAGQTTFAMSVTKSVAALGLGRLVDQGLVDLDAPLSETLVPEWKGTDKASMTFGHVVTHTSGLAGQRYGEKDGNWHDGSVEAHVLAAPLESKPGERWAYNNSAANFVAVLARRAHPEKAYFDDFLQTELFGPLGVVGAWWIKDGRGQPRTSGSLLVRPIDLAKFGQLVLDRGQWHGQPLLSTAWIDRMLQPAALAPWYGLLWWRYGDEASVLAYVADGYLGQYIVVIPEQRVVAVRTRDPRKTSWEPTESTWSEFAWEVLALAGHRVPKDKRNRFGAPPS